MASSPETLRALAEIREALKVQDARLAHLIQQRREAVEHVPMILRCLTELERVIRGGDMHVLPATLAGGRSGSIPDHPQERNTLVTKSLFQHANAHIAQLDRPIADEGMRRLADSSDVLLIEVVR